MIKFQKCEIIRNNRIRLGRMITRMDETALYQITYGLYVVSAEAEGRQSGCVVNTLQQVTAEPVKLAVTVSKKNLTTELIQKAGCFSAVALDQRADLPAIARFGFRSGRDMEKFTDIPCAKDENGMPYPLNNVCARYSCKVIQTLDLDTHLMFVGETTGAELLGEHPALTYTYYRTVIKGKTPENAPSYHKK